MAPENNPPVPSPAIARPTINALLLGAVAHTRELKSRNVSPWSEMGRIVTDPSSKIPIAARKVYLICGRGKLPCLITRSILTDTENGVYPPKRRLHSRCGQKVRTSVPANIFDAIKLIRDFWDGG